MSSDVTPTQQDEYESLIQFLYLAPVGLAQTMMNGDVQLINPACAQMLMPLSKDGQLTNLFTTLEPFAPDLRHLCIQFDKNYGIVCDARQIQLTAGIPGKSDPHVIAITLLKLDQTRLMAVLSDVTVQVRRERQLRQQEAGFSALLTGITDYALIGLDATGYIKSWNASIGRVTGFTSPSVLSQPYAMFYPADAITPDRLQDRLAEADENGWSLDEGYRLRADGSQFWASTIITPLHSGKYPLVMLGNDNPLLENTHYCLVIRDISDKREANELNRRAMLCDHLTGIANRRAFFEAAELELVRMKRTPRSLALIMFDADNFKQINDTYGHPAGDAVLIHLAATLSAAFRPVDTVARIGGEEFAVLMTSTSLDVAIKAADRLRAQVAQSSVVFDGTTIHYTISGGVAAINVATVGCDELMKQADQALYGAKARGRNCIASSGAPCVPPLAA